MNHQVFKVLLVLIAILTGIIVGLIAVGLSRATGATTAAAISRGAVAFGGTVTLVLLINNALGF